jgi:hypothetical protein
MNTRLSRAQSNAIDYVKQHANSRKLKAQESIKEVLRMSNIAQDYFDNAIAKIKAHMKVALHFHPDRLDPKMKTVAEALLESGIYKSQFETLLSSGSVSAHPGGARNIWEHELFGEAYHRGKIDNCERPKYGSLDLTGHPDGPSPRFGSCYFLLHPEISRRCTFTYLDSHLQPDERGTFDAFENILAPLLRSSFEDEIIMGEQLRPPQLLSHLISVIDQSFEERLKKPHRRILDHYIEAQIHGEISLKNDVAVLVADPSFKHSSVGDCLSDICRAYEIDMYWHAGFTMLPENVPKDFRGAAMPSLAKRVAASGKLDVRKIGEAAASLKHNPSEWADRGNEKDVLQELKLLWHVLLCFG